MSIGLVGRKVGMTRIFTDDGDSVPVTVVDVSNNRVAQVKSVENDGYSAVQVVFGLAGPDPDDDDPDAFKEYAFVKTIILETAPELKRSLLSGGGSGGGGPAPWGGK